MMLRVSCPYMYYEHELAIYCCYEFVLMLMKSIYSQLK